MSASYISNQNSNELIWAKRCGRILTRFDFGVSDGSDDVTIERYSEGGSVMEQMFTLTLEEMEDLYHLLTQLGGHISRAYAMEAENEAL